MRRNYIRELESTTDQAMAQRLVDTCTLPQLWEGIKSGIAEQNNVAASILGSILLAAFRTSRQIHAERLGSSAATELLD